MKYHMVERGSNNALEYLTTEPGGERFWTKDRWSAMAFTMKRTAKQEAKDYAKHFEVRVLTVTEL